MSDLEEDGLIERLYDLVATPDDYDTFMLHLQEKLKGLDAGDRSAAAGLLTSHMKRAASLIDIVTPWRREEDGELHDHIAQRLQAAIAFDANARIVDANTAAKIVYDLAPGSGADDLPLDVGERDRLTTMIRQVATGFSARNNPNNVIRFENRITGRPILVRLSSYLQEGTGKSFAIMRTSDVGWPSHLGSILRDLFDVTNAEVEVIRMMVEGCKAKEIAQRRAASITTVRSQLQSIFSKTGTVDQMDCVRMIYGLALMHDVDEGALVAARIEAARETAFFPRENQRHVFKLPSGRQMSYSDFGAKNGDVVLFYHDQAFGDVWFKDAAQAAKQHGLRIISPLRPGFGLTTLYLGEASEPRDFAPDVQALLNHLGIDQVTMLTLSSGLVHGLAAAALMPSRIRAITACHPLLPVLADEDLEGTNGYNYLIPHARLHFPASLKFLCKAGFAFVMRSGPAAFGKAVMRASPRDVEWITRPDILPVMIHGRRVHRDQGYVGNFGDLNYRGDWRPLLTDCPVPVRLVIGEHDRNVQWGSARRWSAELDHVELHVLSDSGYMVHHQQFDQIQRWLKDDLSDKSQA